MTFVSLLVSVVLPNENVGVELELVNEEGKLTKELGENVKLGCVKAVVEETTLLLLGTFKSNLKPPTFGGLVVLAVSGVLVGVLSRDFGTVKIEGAPLISSFTELL